jgi:ATP-dependent helicase HrpB
MLKNPTLPPELPISALRARFTTSLAQGPVVISSPTSSGKSTGVPRWCEGRVLVVEPRRIACRTLAARVAQLEGTALGADVGYVVRDEHVATDATRIVFATPGMVLRNRALLGSARTVILDEFHERSLEIDLLLALLLDAGGPALVIMSATLEGERVAQHVGGAHLTVEGRAFPVEVRYLPGGNPLPDSADLATRVALALDAARDDPGDVLVFLPGKAEIEASLQRVRGPFNVVPLHGGLALDEQRRAFEATSQRKVILATNVAETSLTIPGIGVVIDAGLVRQTRYEAGRGFLSLMPIAEDSAAQRTGRAGRTAPGICYRLWSPAAKLAKTTLPEIHRESLVPLVLTAAAWGKSVEQLPLLDPPKAYALAAARADLASWGALAGEAALSESGQSLFALPIDPQHARLLIAARAHDCLEAMIDLVSVLSVGRPLFVSVEAELGLEDDLRHAGCDATAAIRALRAERPADHALSSFVVREARLTRTRLRRAEGLPERAPVPAAFDRDALVRAAIAADPRVVHVARVRGRSVYFSNGGTEIELARESALQNVRDLEAILALDSRAIGAGRDARVLVTCAMAVPLSLLARVNLGEDRLASVQLDRKRVVARIERVFANRVIAEREETPEGALLRAAMLQLLLRGSLFREAVASTRERLTRAALAAWLLSRGHPSGAKVEGAELSLEAWLSAKLERLGVESGEDLALLSASDFVSPELPYEVRASIENDYPLNVSVGDASYRAEYDLAQSQVTLRMLKGGRAEPPPLSYLPKFPGLRICVESRRGVSVLRAGG